MEKLTKNKDTFMLKAIKLAHSNIKEQKGGPFGAVIVKDGKIVGQGSNHVTTNNDPTAHAEVMAIRRACENLSTFNLEGCEIYSSCEPCPMCLGAIYWARIDKLYYAADKNDAAKADFDDSFIYKEFELTKDKRALTSEQLLQKEAVDVFGEWIESDNKIPY